MKRFFAAFLCVSIVWLSVAFEGSTTIAKAATQQELQDRINQINSEIKQNKDELNALADKKEKQQEYLDTLEKQIDANKDKINTLELQVRTIDNEINDFNNELKKLKSEIDVIQGEIEETNNQITETQSNIDASKDLLSQKLRAAYIQGNDSEIKILMGSKNLAQFLTSLELMKRMSEQDKKIINDFKQQVTELNDAKKKLEAKENDLNDKQTEVEEVKAKSVEKKEELVAKQSEYSAAQNQLEKDHASVEKYVEELDKNSAVYKNYIKNLTDEREAADKEIDRILQEYYASLTTTTTIPSTTVVTTTTTSATSSSESRSLTTTIASTLSSTDGTSSSANNSTSSQSTQASTSSYQSNDTWMWPLGSASCYISSGYGNRSQSISGWSFHGGIDITGGGILDKPVYASRGGTVITAVTVTSDPYGAKGRGYGNYVLIDHGDGFVTLYGHCWKVNVSSGQTVSKGQQIATVGSTGNSTGAHLHFEVRRNGVKQNPSNYVKH